MTPGSVRQPDPPDITFCRRMRTWVSLSERVCSWLKPRAWSSSCWMVPRNTHPLRISDTTWPPPRRPTNDQHLWRRRCEHHDGSLYLNTESYRNPDLPTARLNVYKVPLVLMRCKADAGGAFKRLQALGDEVSFSTGWTVITETCGQRWCCLFSELLTAGWLQLCCGSRHKHSPLLFCFSVCPVLGLSPLLCCTSLPSWSALESLTFSKITTLLYPYTCRRRHFHWCQ